MKIGLLINTIDTDGGIQKNYRLLYELFKSKGIETYLFVLHKPRLITVDDTNIIFLNGFSRFMKGVYLFSQLKQIGQFDLFLVNAEYMKYFLPFNDYYITVHNTWEVKRKGFQGWKKRKKLVSKYKNEYLIGISDSVLDNISDNLKIPIKSKTTIYAPHNFKQVREFADVEVLRPKKYIVGVGTLQKRKNFGLLINAFSSVRKHYPDLELVIVGEGKERRSLERLIHSLQLNDKVHLVGFQENPYPYIKYADLLVSASCSEGLSRVLVEALSLDTPIISTISSEGIYEIMQGELSPYILQENTVEALGKTIALALESYPLIRTDYYQKFALEYVFEKYMELARKQIE